MKSGFHEGRWLVRVLVLLGIAFAVDAMADVLNPTPPTVGRFRGLTDLAIAIFGPRGVAINSAIASAACFHFARSFWRSLARRPTDRLWW